MLLFATNDTCDYYCRLPRLVSKHTVKRFSVLKAWISDFQSFLSRGPLTVPLKERGPYTIFNVFILFSCIFILLSRESDQCAIRARVGVASHLSTTPRWSNPAKCPSQRHNM